MTSAKEPEKDKTGKPAVAKAPAAAAAEAPAKASAQVPAASRADASAARRRLRRVSKGKPAWDKDRTRELFRRYKEEGDEEAREQLIVSHVNLVRYIAAKFKNRGEPLDDLIQVGTIGLIKAIDRFDPSRGLEFTTYATPTIMGEIKRHFRDKGWTIRVPRRLQELSAKVNTVTDELTAELQRSPSIDEIAARLGTTPDEVLEAMESSSAYSSVPLEGQGGTEEDDAPAVIDRYASVDNDLEASDDRMILEDVISEFPEADQQAIRMRYLDGMTQVEIAKKLGISQVQVSRMLRRALRRIQEKIDPEGLMR
ncbi:MAG: SigB/SigF/SigG family RNA polymerase sigma factor [Atopobiaceae bacterium]|uniref:SigB/SigF/SigG family RNA polymerase sigma factor n=1 Tax=Olsenella uli TaxID=133926 RepID=UPI003D79BF3D|nr:SigB/SigF/SigG family RNA polymerase sigma factor [Atopobiaceae bacterium]